MLDCGGRRFGALVHALLASIDLSADVNAVRTVASVQGRMVGATEEGQGKTAEGPGAIRAEVGA